MTGAISPTHEALTMSSTHLYYPCEHPPHSYITYMPKLMRILTFLSILIDSRLTFTAISWSIMCDLQINLISTSGLL